MLEIDGKKFCQQSAICRFLARKFGLMGQDEIQVGNAKLNKLRDNVPRRATSLLPASFSSLLPSSLTSSYAVVSIFAIVVGYCHRFSHCQSVIILIYSLPLSTNCRHCQFVIVLFCCCCFHHHHCLLLWLSFPLFIYDCCFCGYFHQHRRLLFWLLLVSLMLLLSSLPTSFVDVVKGDGFLNS